MDRIKCLDLIPDNCFLYYDCNQAHSLKCTCLALAAALIFAIPTVEHNTLILHDDFADII
jgi:hypothetical protein